MSTIHRLKRIHQPVAYFWRALAAAGQQHWLYHQFRENNIDFKDRSSNLDRDMVLGSAALAWQNRSVITDIHHQRADKTYLNGGEKLYPLLGRYFQHRLNDDQMNQFANLIAEQVIGVIDERVGDLSDIDTNKKVVGRSIMIGTTDRNDPDNILSNAIDITAKTAGIPADGLSDQIALGLDITMEIGVFSDQSAKARIHLESRRAENSITQELPRIPERIKQTVDVVFRYADIHYNPAVRSGYGLPKVDGILPAPP